MMELSYFLSRTPIASEDILEIAPYPAYSSGYDFTGNAGGLSDINLGLSGSSFIEDFTLFLTFEKLEAYSQVLMSNDTGGGGWTLGITSGNFLYLEVTYQELLTHTFTKINLSKTNCLVIKKSGRAFTIYQYDLVSQAFSSVESFICDPVSEVNTSSFIALAGVEDNVTPYRSYFSGLIHQLLFLNGAYEDYYILQVLLGFQPYTLTPSVISSFLKLDESYRFDSPALETNHSFFVDYFTSMNSGLINGLGQGHFIGTATGNYSSGNFTGRVVMSTGLSLCYGTGNLYTGTYTGTATGITGTSYYQDTINYTRNSEFVVISHSITVSGDYYGTDRARFDYDAFYSTVSTTGYTTGVDYSYYTNFKMNGVTSEYAGLIILGTDTGAIPSMYNLNGNFDNVNGYFYLSAYNTGLVYHQGVRIESGLFTVSNGVLNIIGSVQPTDTVIYDNSTGITLLQLGIENNATGDFYSNAALVWTGEVSYTGLFRSKRDFFKETSIYHLYHGVKIQDGGTGELFRL